MTTIPATERQPEPARSSPTNANRLWNLCWPNSRT